MKYVTVLLSALSLGCGGGGSGGGDDSQFIGVYRVRLVAVENSCSFPVEPSTPVYTVNQDGSRIVVDSGSEFVFEGITTGDDRFVVSRVGVEHCLDRDGNEIPSSTFQYTHNIEFIFEDPDSPRVIFTSNSGNCSGNTFVDATCQYSLTGTADREA